MECVYSQLEDSNQLALKYSSFSYVHIQARAGVFLDNIFCCINIANQRIELYQETVLLGSWDGTFVKTSAASIRVSPNMYLLEMRKRGNRMRVYSGNANTLRFMATIAATSGYCGIHSDVQIKCELIRLGNAWTYEPYETFDVTMPDGTLTQYGRIARSGVSWNNEFQVFTLQNELEESATRSEDISMDYDFFHSGLLRIPCNADYTAKVVPKNINLWIFLLFIGDADGFSILYYQEVGSLVY